MNLKNLKRKLSMEIERIVNGQTVEEYKKVQIIDGVASIVADAQYIDERNVDISPSVRAELERDIDSYISLIRSLDDEELKVFCASLLVDGYEYGVIYEHLHHSGQISYLRSVVNSNDYEFSIDYL